MGGAFNISIIINIIKSSRTAVIQSLCSQTFNYTIRETILSNIAATPVAKVLTSYAILSTDQTMIPPTQPLQLL